MARGYRSGGRPASADAGRPGARGRPAAALNGCDFRPVVLQRAPAAGEVAALRQGLGRPVLDLSALNDDLDGMLALLSLLDDSVAVSNTNVHLVAALGRTARVLLPSPPEYRWLVAGETSPWFPGFQLYRHDRATGWPHALARVADALGRAFVRGGKPFDPLAG